MLLILFAICLQGAYGAFTIDGVRENMLAVICARNRAFAYEFAALIAISLFYDTVRGDVTIAERFPSLAPLKRASSSVASFVKELKNVEGSSITEFVFKPTYFYKIVSSLQKLKVRLLNTKLPHCFMTS